MSETGTNVYKSPNFHERRTGETQIATFTPAIEYIETYPNETAAREGFGFLATQTDYLAGRIVAPNNYGQPKWRTQTIFEGNDGALPLPDGCRHVLWRGRLQADRMTGADLRALRKRLGLTQPQLGAILDLHWSRISVYERGHAPIPMAVAIAVRHLVECPAPRK